MPFVYVLVRTDLPLADQLVQVGHACLDAGTLFQPTEPCHMAVLAVASEERLMQAVEKLAPIRMALFHEPDDGMGWTAACSEPLKGKARNPFRRFPLWKPH